MQQAKKTTQLAYDGSVTIATGLSRHDVAWKNKDFTWSTLCARFSDPTRTSETAAEYKALPKAKRDEIKDVGGFVGGMLKGGRRKAEAVACRTMLTLDLDHVTADPWPIICDVIGCAAVIYSTHSHTAEAQRLRIIIPLSRPVIPDEYAALSRLIAGDIGIDMCDDTTYEPSRLMYWPSCSADAEYRFEYLDAPWLDPDNQLQRYHDWTDSSEWPVSSRQTDLVQRKIKRQGDPLQKPGLVGAFCRAYDIRSAIDTFLPDVYKPAGNDRYTYVPGSTVGGLVIYDDKFAYSHHGTDPAGGQLCNAFDLIRLHQFSDLDVDTDKTGTELPSYQAMCSFAAGLDSVRAELLDFDAGEDWLKLLEFDQKGAIRCTVDNLIVILEHDPALKGKLAYDEFRERPVILGDLPWAENVEPGTIWSDSDDAGFRWYVEKQYRLSNKQKTRDAVDTVLQKTRVHPVREYLESLTWDGAQRVDELLLNCFETTDSPYHRAVIRKSLIGAVARIYKPGCKHDHMLVLVGPQGCGKSTFLSKLGGKWFSDSLFTVVGKTAYEQVQGAWLIEFAEMAATRRAEIEQIKQFLSKQTDSYRAAYDRRTSEHPRQCAFFGTTNDKDFLRDATGGRRFWPVTVSKAEGKLDGLTQAVIDQVWAEAVTYYKRGEPWFLPPELEAEAAEKQKKHMELNGYEGMIEHWLDIPLPPDWDGRFLDDRRAYWYKPSADGLRRSKVCAVEIWVELFNGDLKAFTLQQSRLINSTLRYLGWQQVSKLNFGPIYGNQRGFIRDE